MSPILTIKDLENSKVAGLNSDLIKSLKEKKQLKKSKFGNNITYVDEIRFDSKKEAKRYKELLLMLKAGLIGVLELQKPYELNAGGNFSLKYVADFVYMDLSKKETPVLVVEDVKGHRTAEYKKKKKLMLKIHGIKIKEV